MWGCSTGVRDEKQRCNNGYNMGSLKEVKEILPAEQEDRCTSSTRQNVFFWKTWFFPKKTKKQTMSHTETDIVFHSEALLSVTIENTWAAASALRWLQIIIAFVTGSQELLRHWTVYLRSHQPLDNFIMGNKQLGSRPSLVKYVNSSVEAPP